MLLTTSPIRRSFCRVGLWTMLVNPRARWPSIPRSVLALTPPSASPAGRTCWRLPSCRAGAQANDAATGGRGHDAAGSGATTEIAECVCPLVSTRCRATVPSRKRQPSGLPRLASQAIVPLSPGWTILTLSRPVALARPGPPSHRDRMARSSPCNHPRCRIGLPSDGLPRFGARSAALRWIGPMKLNRRTIPSPVRRPRPDERLTPEMTVPSGRGAAGSSAAGPFACRAARFPDSPDGRSRDTASVGGSGQVGGSRLRRPRHGTARRERPSLPIGIRQVRVKLPRDLRPSVPTAGAAVGKATCAGRGSWPRQAGWGCA